MKPTEKLLHLGVRLPEAPRPVASYLPAVRSGDLVFVSGQLPFEAGELLVRGRVGVDVDLETARQAALNGLAAVNSVVDLDEVIRVVKVTGYVSSGPDFFDQPKVINGASDLLADIFGDSGRHARAAVGVSGLPLNAPVEVEMIVQVRS